LLALVLVSGCIYVDPINQRPSLDIEREGGSEVFRGDVVTMHAVANDPEEQLVFFQWRAYACTDATEDASGARPGCDAVPFYTEILEDAQLIVPPLRTDVIVPTEQVLVLLEGQDDYGATAKPVQRLVIPISNAPPDVRLQAASGRVCPLDPSGRCYTVNKSIDLFAKVGDADDWPTVPELDWTVYSPMNQPTWVLADPSMPVEQDPADTKHLVVGKIFTPKGIGDYEIRLTAMDTLERECVAQGRTDCTSGSDKVMVHVVEDGPPCLSQWAPLAATAPNAWPLTDPTLFQVTVVLDDLDSFPGSPTEPSQLAFHWSILPPGASARQALSTTGNAVALDPASYQPGDIVELRVEIEDRNNTPVNCVDASATCSVISNNTCIQRQTWRVEVR
jgi:hypothetical protein